MLCYKLESDEVALFESDVSLKENKDKNVILITNHNIVIETTKKKMFKRRIPIRIHKKKQIASPEAYPS